MAIYHFSMKVIKRSAGRSATAAAAYRAGLTIGDERTGEIHRYENRGGVVDHAVLAPSRSPEWAHEAASLWNEVEKKERRKDAQLARENVVALPHELSIEQNRELVHGFVQEAYIRRGMAAQVDIHRAGAEGDDRNIHAHVLLTMRGITRNGWKENKARSWNEKETLREWRGMWADHVNQALERAGVKERVTEKSFEDLGLDRVPTNHLGPDASQMERRGWKSRIGDENRAADEQNRKLAALHVQQEILHDVVRKEAARVAEDRAKAAQAQRERWEQEERQKGRPRSSPFAGAFAAQQEATREAQRRDVLDRGPGLWAQVEKDFAREEQEIVEAYGLDRLQEQVAEARARVAAVNTANGRFTGAYEAAREETEALERSLRNAQERQQEALQRVEHEREAIRAAREEREAEVRSVMDAKLNAQFEEVQERQSIEQDAPVIEQDNAPGPSVEAFEEDKGQDLGQDDGMEVSR